MAVLNYRRADHPFRCRPSDMPIVEVLLTMGHLNLLLTCIVTVMTGYLGTYSAYVEPRGLPWSLDYGPYEARLCRLEPSPLSALTSAFRGPARPRAPRSQIASRGELLLARGPAPALRLTGRMI
jgi:hypothetical protein